METSGGGEGKFLEPFGWLAFSSEARKHLSYSLWLKACIAKLVISLATCHTSTPEDGGMEMFGFAVSNRTQCPPHWAYTPWLEGGWVSKACLWKRELNWHCKVSLLESWHCPPFNEPGQKKCRVWLVLHSITSHAFNYFGWGWGGVKNVQFWNFFFCDIYFWVCFGEFTQI